MKRKIDFECLAAFYSLLQQAQTNVRDIIWYYPTRAYPKSRRKGADGVILGECLVRKRVTVATGCYSFLFRRPADTQDAVWHRVRRGLARRVPLRKRSHGC
jgi:hypothetical protein